MLGSVGSGRIAFEQRAATFPGVSWPSRVVRSQQRIASSSAHSFASRLMLRFASSPARASTATWSTEPIRGSRCLSGSSKPAGKTGACAIAARVAPGRRRPVDSTAVAQAEIGVFGGSGFYSFVDVLDEVDVETPYGKPSAPIVIGEVGGRRVAFLPRHGRAHELPPAQIPYRANVWAMRELGVRRLIGPNASGALKAELELGEFVVCDQFVDRTTGRADTFYEGPETTHVSAADPYCPDLRRILLETAAELGIKARDGGTVVVIQGPRFSTRAESRWFQDAGWDTINMTAYPEGYLARELELCYANISMVTDHDVGVEGTVPVSHAEVVKVFGENNERLRELLFAAIPRIGPQPEDVCATALRGARI